MSYQCTYDLLEDGIVALLKPLADDGVEVIRTPETDQENTKAFEKNRITIMYSASEYSDQIVKGYPPVMSTSEISMMEYAEVIIHFQSRLLRGANGLHIIKERACKLLLGARPKLEKRQWGRIFFKEYKFIQHKDNVHQWALIIIVGRPIVQDCAGQAAAALINSDNTGLIEHGNGEPLVQVNINTAES